MQSAWHKALSADLISLTAENLFATTVLLLLAFLGFSLWLFPTVGIPLTEVAFPLIALWILLRGKRDLLGPDVAFPVLYLIWYWIGTIPLVSAYEGNTLLDPFDASQWLMYIIGFAGLWCGLNFLRGRVDNPHALRGLSVRWHDDLFLLLVVFSAMIFLSSWAIIVSREGITVLQADVEAMRVSVSTDNHITFQILMLSKLVFPLIYLYLWTSKPPRFRVALYTLSVVIVLILTSTGNRSMALDSLLTVFALRQYIRKSYKLRHLLLVAVVLISALSLSGYYRAVQHSGMSHVEDLEAMGFPVAVQPFTDLYLYVRAPLDTLRNVAQQIPANTPYQHGALTAGFVAQLLPGRHPGSDFYFKQLVGGRYDGLGQPASILGPFYGDFGLAGIFAGMFMVGLTSKYLYLRMFQYSFICLLLYCYLWQLLISSVYGALFTYIVQLLIPIGWIVFVWLLAGKVTRHPRGDSGLKRFSSSFNTNG